MNKNRTIYYFNPTCEMAVANGSPYYNAPSLLHEFENTLSTLMLCFAEKDDFLIRSSMIDAVLIENIHLLGLPTIKTANKEEILRLVQENGEKIRLSPWGWSPAAQNYLKDFEPYSLNLPASDPDFFRKRYERKNALLLLRKIVNEIDTSEIISESSLPQIIHTPEEIEQLLIHWGQIVLKAPISSSGRGIQIIRQQKLNTSKLQWIRTILQQQGYLIAEPLHDNVADFSFQYQITSKQEVKYLGISYFKTGKNGQYMGHYLNSQPEIFSLINQQIDPELINKLAEFISHFLSKSAYHENESFIGVDALVYKENGKFKIYPCVEINPRFNMGILSLYLKKYIHPQSKGSFEIYHANDLIYSEFAKKETTKNPPKMMNGKLQSGFLSLTDFSINHRFGAYIKLDTVQ